MREMVKIAQFVSILTNDIIDAIQKTAEETLLSIYKTDLDLLFDPQMLALYSYFSALDVLGENREKVFTALLERIAYLTNFTGVMDKISLKEEEGEEKKKRVDIEKVATTMKAIKEEMDGFVAMVG